MRPVREGEIGIGTDGNSKSNCNLKNNGIGMENRFNVLLPFGLENNGMELLTKCIFLAKLWLLACFLNVPATLNLAIDV